VPKCHDTSHSISYVEVEATDLLWVANSVPKERQRDIDARREVVLRQVRVLKLRACMINRFKHESTPGRLSSSGVRVGIRDMHLGADHGLRHVRDIGASLAQVSEAIRFVINCTQTTCARAVKT
jgi:hypothetical protein